MKGFAVVFAAVLIVVSHDRSIGAGLDQMRAFARATALAYGKASIPDVVAAPSLYGEGARWDGRRVTIDPRFVASPHLVALVAHELAHFVLAHETLPEITPEDEVEATALSVEILTRVLGMSEREALRRVYGHFIAAHRGPPVALPGHRPPCEEIAEVLERFPRHRSWTATLECGSGRSSVAAGSPRISDGPRSRPPMATAPVPSGVGPGEDSGK